MPVGLGEIGANHEVFRPIGVEHMAQCVAPRVVLEGMAGDGEVGLLTVPKAESIVVLRGENHVFHARLTTYLRPLPRVEVARTKSVGQGVVPIDVLLIGHGGVAAYPVLVADAPRLHDARQTSSPATD